jgi:hypothetical protein
MRLRRREFGRAFNPEVVRLVTASCYWRGEPEEKRSGPHNAQAESRGQLSAYSLYGLPLLYLFLPL